MKSRISLSIRVFLICAFILSLFSISFGQTNWLELRDFSRISFSAAKVALEGGIDQTLLSTIWFASGNIVVSDKLAVVFEVPFVHFDAETNTSFNFPAENLLGNPYLGLKAGAVNNGPYGMFGVRLPIASDDKPNAAIMGAFSHFDRYEAFAPDLFSISAGGGYRSEGPSGAGLMAELGGTFWMPTEDGPDSELLLNYKFGFRYRSEKAGFTWTFKGRMILTESDLNFGERTFHMLGMSADVQWGKVYPGLHIYFPVEDDLSSFFNMVYGLNLTMMLGEEDRVSSGRSNW